MSVERQDTTSSLPGALHPSGPMPNRAWPAQAGFLLLIGIAAFFLLTEHRAHLFAGLSWLPILLLLACPLIHMFSHGGHGGHEGHRKDGKDAADASPPATPGADDRTGPRAPHSRGGETP